MPSLNDLDQLIQVNPPRGRAEAHYHDGHEAAIFFSSRRTCPTGVNLSMTGQVIAVAARNDPNVHSSVVIHHPEENT